MEMFSVKTGLVIVWHSITLSFLLIFVVCFFKAN